MLLLFIPKKLIYFHKKDKKSLKIKADSYQKAQNKVLELEKEINNIHLYAEDIAMEDKEILGSYISKYYTDWTKINNIINEIITTEPKNSKQGKQNIKKIIKEISELLNTIKLIVGVATTVDVSCNIKVWHQKYFLTTKWRALSDMENNKRSCDLLKNRLLDEFFLVVPKKPINYIRVLGAKEHTNEVKNKKNGETKPKKRYNSAYNEIFSNSESSWIGNDLPKMVDNNEYYSSSDDYEKFYTSLAIFRMEDPTMEQGMLEMSGLLIFDTFDEKFDKKIIEPYGNFLASSMHFLLSNLKIANEKVANIRGHNA